MKVAAVLAVVALVGAPAWAGANFSDDFESGMGAWTAWPGASGGPLSQDASHNYTPGGQYAARATEGDPAWWASTADFGVQSGFVRAEVFLWDDVDDAGDPARPSTAMLALIGEGTQGTFGTDYLQLGIVPFYPAGDTGYGFRTKYNDNNALGYGNANFARVGGWTKLAIEADALADGGQVRFYINDGLVGTSQRSGMNLQYVRLGNNSKSYDNFWYDDLSVTPEPASLALLALGGLALRRRIRA